MNLCIRNCKHYEYCLPLRYNNCRKQYMKEISLEHTKDDMTIIYVSKCSEYQRTNYFSKTIGVGVKNARHSQKQKVARKKKADTKER